MDGSIERDVSTLMTHKDAPKLRDKLLSLNKKSSAILTYATPLRIRKPYESDLMSKILTYIQSL